MSLCETERSRQGGLTDSGLDCFHGKLDGQLPPLSSYATLPSWNSPLQCAACRRDRPGPLRLSSVWALHLGSVLFFPPTATRSTQSRHGLSSCGGGVLHRMPAPETKGEGPVRAADPHGHESRCCLTLTALADGSNQCNREFPCNHCLKRGVSHLCRSKAVVLKSPREARSQDSQPRLDQPDRNHRAATDRRVCLSAGRGSAASIAQTTAPHLMGIRTTMTPAPMSM